jgi:glycosyltransferase involved in cell wall biosynthesis
MASTMAVPVTYSLAAKPVVGFAQGALPETVRHGETGLLVPAGDETALGGAVAALLEDEPRRRALGRAAREHAGRRFDSDRMVGELSALMERLPAGAAAGG